MNITDELERLGKLHKDVALSDTEFEQAKTKLLSQSGGDVPPMLDKPLTEAKFHEYLERRKILKLIALLVIFVVVLIFIIIAASPHGFRH
jgi:hypothetical protein